MKKIKKDSKELKNRKKKMHKKISEMPKEWPIPRKGKKYIALASHHDKKGIPIVFALRDMLKVATTRREVRKICLEGNVKINGTVRKDIAFPILPRDILSLEKIGKRYILKQNRKKLGFEEAKIGNIKVSKVVDKMLLKKGKLMASLDDGSNLIVTEKISCGDSILFDFEKKKIIKVIPLKKGSHVEVIMGRHLGEKGAVESLGKEGDEIVFEIKLEGGKKVFLKKKTLLAIE
jgi:small subunit ribosomal protein S4e